jgi:hypothetical protein
MTPFEKSTDIVHSLAERLCFSLAMQDYLPILNEIEQKEQAAIDEGDIKLMVELMMLRATLTQKISQSAFEA